jgi:peptide/nickel transport system ATP-binding protein
MTDTATDMVPLLEVRGLSVEFQTRGGTAHVLEDIQLHIQRGETLGLVGESGCGKSITALASRLAASPQVKLCLMAKTCCNYQKRKCGVCAATVFR